jgi:S-methylmethionine-dependent homocysteine/selenocysteine methylase
MPGSTITVLDGGMGHMLRRLGVVIEGEIGSQQRFLGVALANSAQSELVVAAHLAYIKAGATAITTNNYAVVPKTLSLPGGSHGLQDLEKLVVAAADCAHTAIDQAVAEGIIKSKADVQVAGSLPPLAASYRADLVGSVDEMTEAYDRITAALSPKVDVFLCETMSTALEGKTAATSAAKHGRPVWVSWALQENEDGAPTLWSGEPLEAAVDDVADIAGVEKLLINCSSVNSVSKAVPILKQKADEGVEVGGYANGFVTVKSDGKGSDYDEDLTPEKYASIAKGWIHNGATVIGGCCGVFPEHIVELGAVAKAASE